MAEVEAGKIKNTERLYGEKTCGESLWRKDAGRDNLERVLFWGQGKVEGSLLQRRMTKRKGNEGRRKEEDF